MPSDITSYNEIEPDGGFLLAMDPKDAWTPQLERDFLAACDWDAATMQPSEAKLRELKLDDLIPVLQGA